MYPAMPPYWVFGFGDRPHKLMKYCGEDCDQPEGKATRLRVYWDHDGWYADVSRDCNGCQLVALYDEGGSYNAVTAELTDKSLYNMTNS